MAKIVGIKAMNRQQIREYVRQRLLLGIRSAAPFMRDRLKQVVGVQAPRRRVNYGSGWVATVAATAGAPPRRVSGQGQAGIYYKVTKNGVSFRSRKRYMQYLEYTGHPWLQKTLVRYKPEFIRIMGQSVNERRHGYAI